jgi:hypothetical protein
MAGPSQEAGGVAKPARIRRRAPRRILWAGLLIAAVVVALYLPTPLGLPWAPLVRWTCTNGDAVENVSLFSPGVIWNSPYGGGTWANGTFPPPGGLGAGGYLPNGATGVAAAVTWFHVYLAQNSSVWGYGPSTRCTAKYLVTAEHPRFAPVTGGAALGENNTTDANVAQFLPPFGGSPGSVEFDARYHQANSRPVTTCGDPVGESDWVYSSSLTVGVPVNDSGENFFLPVVLAVSASFHYWFPPHFGTWNVDNLSMDPGLTGAGWAFEYHPCSSAFTVASGAKQS